MQFSSVQSLRHVRHFATPWIAARQASLSITNSWSPPRPTSIKSVTPSSHLILGRPLLLLPPNPPSIRVFSNESTLRIRWPKYWSFSFSIIPSKDSFRKCSTWMQSQRWKNDLSSFPRQTIQYHCNTSLCPNQKCWRSWSWTVLWRPTRPSRTNTQKRCPFHYRGMECKIGSQETLE